MDNQNYYFMMLPDRDRGRDRESEPSIVQSNTEQRKFPLLLFESNTVFVCCCCCCCCCFLLAFSFHCLQPAPGSVVISFVYRHLKSLVVIAWRVFSFTVLCFYQNCKAVLHFFFNISRQSTGGYKLSHGNMIFFFFLLFFWIRDAGLNLLKLEQK